MELYSEATCSSKNVAVIFAQFLRGWALRFARFVLISREGDAILIQSRFLYRQKRMVNHKAEQNSSFTINIALAKGLERLFKKTITCDWWDYDRYFNRTFDFYT